MHDKRVAVLIDGGYMDKILYEAGSMKVSFSRLANKLARAKPLLRTYYYHCLPHISQRPTPEEQTFYANKERFFNALRRLDDFEVRLGHLAPRGWDNAGNRILEQKGVDVYLAVDVCRLSYTGAVSEIILVAGDGDLAPAVALAKDLGIKVCLWFGESPSTRVSEQLWYICDQRRALDVAILEECLLAPATERRDNDAGQL